jgi:phage terminase large subunit
MENLTNLIKRVELTEIILNSNLMMLKNNEKYLFFKKVCDEFIESGSDYKYDKKLGLLFTKESDVDTLTSLYTLDFIGVDKDFTL